MKKQSEILLSILNRYKVIIATTVLSALLVLGFVLIFAQSRDSKAYAVAGAQIDELSQNIIKHYRVMPSYWGLSTTEVINKKLYPDSMNVKDGKLVGFFANRVEVGADENGSTVMPGIKSFVITYNNISKNQCIELGSHKYNEEFWLNVSKIVIKNADTEQEFIWGDEKYGLIPNKKMLKDLCKNNSNKLLVYF